jgi:hypothetical protein
MSSNVMAWRIVDRLESVEVNEHRRLTIDKKPVAVLALDPVRYPAVSRPCPACFRILILRCGSGLCGINGATALAGKKVLLCKTVFHYLHSNFGNNALKFERSSSFSFLGEQCKLLSKSFVGCHGAFAFRLIVMMR